MSLVRGSSLQGFGELVAELGADPAPLLAAARIAPGTVGNPDAFISDRAVIAVLQSAAAATAAPDFGRRLALRQGVEILGPVGVAARTASTLAAALASIDEYMSVYSPSLSATVAAQPGGRVARFAWRVTLSRPPVHDQAAELGLGVSLRIFRLLAGTDFAPTSVEFQHQPLTAVADYVRYFGCPVRFGAPFTGLLFPSAFLGRPLPGDGAVHDIVRDYLATIALPTDAAGVEPEVRILIRRMLPTGGLSLDLVAAQLALSPRTLQRRLADGGTTFAGLVDDVRREEAERFLRDTDMGLVQLAGLLGYREQSVLTRAAHRWFGAAPRQYRRDLTRPSRADADT